MPSPKPIVKIKRGNTPPTTQLTAGELGVDLATNRLYIGNNIGVAVAIGAEVDTAITLGGTNTSDNKIATEKAAKDYITSNLVVGTQLPKDTLFATISHNPANSGGQLQNIDLSSAIIAQSINMNLQRDDPNFGSLTTGFFQTTKTEMILNVTYSLQISAVDPNNAIVPEGTNIGFWRLAGLRVIDTNTINTTSLTTYYGMQVVLPVIGTSPISLPTLISGNACVRLPKYVSGGTQWELQLVYQIRSNDLSLDIGTGGSNNIVNDPEIGAAKGIRIQIVKISESAT